MNKNEYHELIKNYNKSINTYILNRFLHWSINSSDVAMLFGVRQSLLTVVSTGDTFLTLEHILQYCLFFHETPMKAFEGFKYDFDRILALKRVRATASRNLSNDKQCSKIASAGFKNRKARLLAQCANETSEYKRICIKLNIALQELRIEGGMSQNILAANLGVADYTIHRLEKGDVNLKFKHLVAHALVLGIDPIAVFARADINWQQFVNKKIPFDVNMFVENKKNTVKTDWRKGLAKIEIE